MKLHTFRIGGVHPAENKLTADMPTRVAPLPTRAIFPLGQHIGAPAKAVVGRGDKVKVGTLIAEASGFVSAPVYSSVSGTVFKLTRALMPPATVSLSSLSMWRATSGRKA